MTYYDRMIYPSKFMNLSQIGAKFFGTKTYSHPGYELDEAGVDTGVDHLYNMMPNTMLKCIAQSGTSGTYYFVTADKNGKDKCVLCPDGHLHVVTIAVTHSNKKWVVGRLYGYREAFYSEGTMGMATGNHVHMEVCIGRCFCKVGSGCYVNGKQVATLPDEADPRKIFFLLDGWNVVKNTKGLYFGHTKTAEAKGWVRDEKGWWYLNDNGSWLKDGWKKLDAWYYFNADGYALMDEWIKHTDGKWYFLGNDCRMKTNSWIEWKGKKCYVGSDGAAYTSRSATINGRTYKFDQNGYVIS